MQITNFEDSKILYTNNIWKWIKQFKLERDVIIITPLTKPIELLNLKSASLLRVMIDEKVNDLITKGLNYDYLDQAKMAINTKFNANVLTLDLNHEKLLKTLFVPNDELVLEANVLNKYLQILDANTTRQLHIIVVGFDIDSEFNYSMLNVHQLVNNVSKSMKWENIEQLVFLDVEDSLEIINADKFKSWLELKTKTVLTKKDINSYFQGEPTFQSFLIDKALRDL